MTALTLKPTDLGSGKLENDFEVFDADRKPVGRIMLHPQAPTDRPWFWTVTARVPQQPTERGYAATREKAMAEFRSAWDQMPDDNAEALIGWGKRNIQGE
jgi:hypothetical protein